MSPLAELLGIAADLGVDELRVLLEVGRSLKRRRALFGKLPIALEPRDVIAEGLEKAGDLAVSLSAELLLLRDAIASEREAKR